MLHVFVAHMVLLYVAHKANVVSLGSCTYQHCLRYIIPGG